LNTYFKPYLWKTGKLKGKKVSGYTRKAKPKKQIGVHPAYKRKLEVQYYIDNQGRLASKRKVKVCRIEN
jgi:hypothetical protein